MQPILLHLLSIALYAALGICFWRHCTSGDNLPLRRTMSSHERVILLIAIVIQGLTLHADMFPGDGMRLGFGLAVSLTIWLAVCFYWIETFYARLDGLHIMVIPAGLLGSLLPLLFPGQYFLAHVASPGFRAHFIVAMLASSLFTLAALQAVLMAFAERQLHSGHIGRFISILPPLLTMESLLFRLIGIAFIPLTLTLISGVFFSEHLYGQPFQLTHKTIFAFTSWLLFGVLLFGRYAWGWRGRIALRWTIAGFATLILAYLGSRFVFEILLQRAY